MTYSMLPTLIFLFALTAFGYWHKDRVLLVLSGLGFIVDGFTIWSTNEWLSILTVVAGMYLVIKAFWDRRRKADE